MRCLLKGSEHYCETGAGICCRDCPDAADCKKACANAPGRCGYAGELVGGNVQRIPRTEEGGSHADHPKAER